MPKVTKKSEVGEEIKVKKVKTYKSLRGFRDVLPESQVYWDAIEDAARKIANDYSFDRIRLPYLEQTQLFEKSVGKGTDIVDKEMFSFLDPSETKVTMRPEATAQVVRSYIEHGMLNKPQPVKLWYLGPMFRHDRPQAGRYRQFWQFGLEAIGSKAPIIDAQIIIILYRLLRELGLDITIQINSIGTIESRREYIMELVSYFKQFRRQLSDIDKKRLQKNPLRLLDSKEPEIQELKVDAPQVVDWLDENSKQDFMKVLEYLDEAEVRYELNPFLVRGLDYYSKTVFEIVPTVKEGDEHKNQNALGGGGRYDGLVEMLGGREETFAMGAALGIERVILAMKAQGIELNQKREVDVFFCQLGDAARRKGLVIFEDFRLAGIPAAEAFSKGSLKTQLEMADKMNAKVSLILGQKEVLDGTIIIRDMESGAQEIVDVKKVINIVKRQIGR